MSWVVVLLACGGPSDPSAASPSDSPSPTAPVPQPTTTPTPEPTTGPTTQPTEPYVWPEGATVLPDVTVVDGAGARGPVTVVLTSWPGGTIDYVGADPGAPPDDATVLDVAGHTVVPGLIDSHVHLFLSGTSVPVGDTLRAQVRANLYRGVTSVVDVGGPLEGTGVRDLLTDAGALSVKVMGPMLTTWGSHPCEVLHDEAFCAFADTEAEGLDVALAHGAAGTDGLKAALADAAFTPWPTPRLDPAVLGAAAAATAGPTVVHVDTVHDAEEALDQGASHLAHPVFGDVLEPADAAELASRAGAVHTTIGAFSGTLDLLEGRLALDAPELHPAIAASWRADADPRWFDPDWLAGSAAWWAQAEASVVGLHAAGGVVLPASDAGYLYVPHGLGLHTELERLSALGWSNQELLEGVTVRAAEAWGWLDRGAVTEGLRADLVVVDGDPLTDLSVLREPLWVVVDGQARTPDAWLSDPLELADGEVCTAPASDCGSGRVCDTVTHRCADACTIDRWPVDDDCGTDAFCAFADGRSAPLGCRDTRTCDPYTVGSCGPFYDEACVPLDLDTFACSPSGPGMEGDSCDAYTPGAGCAPGLYCSSIDARCYAYCDPALGETQAVCGNRRCEAQYVGAELWFGLCL